MKQKLKFSLLAVGLSTFFSYNLVYATTEAAKTVTPPIHHHHKNKKMSQVLLKVKYQNSLDKDSWKQGDICITLNPEKAKVTVANFLGYVKDKFYDGTVFHRVIPGFMIQGGGFTSDVSKTATATAPNYSLQQKTTKAPISIAESSNGLKNDKYTIAMARTSEPNSATSQFFINLVNNDFLNYVSASNPGYTVFGIVTSGTEVVDAIAKLATGNLSNGMQNVPLRPAIIEWAKVGCSEPDHHTEHKK